MNTHYSTVALLFFAACTPLTDTNADIPQTASDSHSNVDDAPPDPALAESLGLTEHRALLPREALPFPGIDTDGDGLYDAFEQSQGLDPLNPDTDGDGIHDHWDLLGSERALVAPDDDGFAWFDPSVTEDIPPLSDSVNVIRKALYGVYLDRTQEPVLVLFSVGTAGPEPIDCTGSDNSTLRCFGVLYHSWSDSPDHASLNFETGATGLAARWSYSYHIRQGSMRPDAVYSDQRLFQPQTAPTGQLPERHWGPDPDADGLDALAEFLQGTDPLLWDTDGDGTPDAAEVAAGHNPRLADTDLDGVDDTAESLANTNAVDGDSDRDGLLDDDEALLGTNPMWRDTDHDGLFDALEQLHGTHPLDVDSNNDGIGDGQWLNVSPRPLNLSADWSTAHISPHAPEGIALRSVMLRSTPQGPDGQLVSTASSSVLWCVEYEDIALCEPTGRPNGPAGASRDTVRIMRTHLGFDVLLAGSHTPISYIHAR